MTVLDFLSNVGADAGESREGVQGGGGLELAALMSIVGKWD